jgi:hypothetical protein
MVGRPTLGVTEMSCSAVSNRVLNAPLSSDGIAPQVDLLSFSVRAGDPVHCPEHAGVDGTGTATAVIAV